MSVGLAPCHASRPPFLSLSLSLSLSLPPAVPLSLDTLSLSLLHLSRLGALSALTDLPWCSLPSTCSAHQWGFKGCGPKSTQTIAAFKRLAAQEAVPFLDLGATAGVGSDGIHFQAGAGPTIGAAVAAAVKRAMAPAKKARKIEIKLPVVNVK